MLLALLLLAQDPLQDPASGWKSFGVGASVRMKSTTRIEGKAEVVGESKVTLVEKTADKLVLETETTIRKETRKEKREILLKDKKGTATVKVLGQGDETLALDGKEMKCKWIESEVETTEGGYATKAVTKVWICEEIPGRLAKVVVKVSQPQALEMELVVASYEKK